MSDDEYYAESPYDEFEEMLWDADPAPNLADDLAQHTAYSPIWQDDPVGELEQYHSDWEYYSDDYFDDDPAMLKDKPLAGSPPRIRSTGQLRTKRGRKRKLDEACEAYEAVENKCLRSTIQGTVWAKNVAPEIKTFQGGQQEKVALMTDWRERFLLSSDRFGLFNKLPSKEDESWANDLSLADMGLMQVQERKGTQEEAVTEDHDQDEEPGDENEDLLAEGYGASTPEGDYVRTFDEAQLQTSSCDLELEQLRPRREDEVDSGKTLDSGKTQDTSERTVSSPRKRAKVSASSPPPPPSRSKAKKTIWTTSDASQNVDDQIHSYGVKTKYSPQPETRYVTEESQKDLENVEGTRKRKLSSPTGEISGILRSTASTGAKRVASTKLTAKQKNVAMKESRALNTRTTRAQKR